MVVMEEVGIEMKGRDTAGNVGFNRENTDLSKGEGQNN